MGLLPDTQNCGLHMRRTECQECFPRLWLKREPPVSNPDMHHGMHPGIPGACATGSFAYRVRGLCINVRPRGKWRWLRSIHSPVCICMEPDLQWLCGFQVVPRSPHVRSHSSRGRSPGTLSCSRWHAHPRSLGSHHEVHMYNRVPL